MGVLTQFSIYGSVGPLECIFMALLTLSNEGAPAHFFSPYGGTHNEAPKRKNVATLAL